MVSRQECDESFQVLGFPRFIRQPSAYINDLVKYQQDRIANTSSNNLSLINAQRCNSFCTDTDSNEQCDLKLQIAFDRSGSAELCYHKPYACYYLLRPILEADVITVEPIDPSTNWSAFLFNNGYKFITFSKLSQLYPNIARFLQLPLDLSSNKPISPSSLNYVINPAINALLQTFFHTKSPLPPLYTPSPLPRLRPSPRSSSSYPIPLPRSSTVSRLPVVPSQPKTRVAKPLTASELTEIEAGLNYPLSNGGRQCYSNCTKNFWGYYPYPRYGCWTSSDQDRFDLCDPESPASNISLYGSDDDEDIEGFTFMGGQSPGKVLVV